MFNAAWLVVGWLACNIFFNLSRWVKWQVGACGAGLDITQFFNIVN